MVESKSKSGVVEGRSASSQRRAPSSGCFSHYSGQQVAIYGVSTSIVVWYRERAGGRPRSICQQTVAVEACFSAAVPPPLVIH